MAMTAQEIFTKIVQPLPTGERIRLAALILGDLAKSDVVEVDRGDAWGEQDRKDLTAFSLKYAEERYPEEQELVYSRRHGCD
ncbi:MAG: hypothetical protein GY859_26025 [Desulfobacterales bacterium]|nr:hypothetical protein [Desulfobacterales bacterium]